MYLERMNQRMLEKGLFYGHQYRYAKRDVGGSDAEVEQAPTLTPGQLDLLNSLTSLLGGQLGQQGRIMPNSLAPLGQSPLQSQAFGYAAGLPGQMQFDPNAINEAMAPVGDYAQNMFQQQTIPAIMNALGGAGSARSSGAVDMLGRAGKDLSMGLASQFAPMQFQAYQNAQNRQMQVPGILAGMGGQQRGIGTENLAFQRQQWGQADPWSNPALNMMPLALGTQAFENVVKPGSPGLVESLAPAMGSMAGGMFMGAGAAGSFGNLFGGPR